MKKTLMVLGLGAILAQASFANSIGIGYGITDPIFKNDEKGYILPLVDYEYNGFFISGGDAYGIALGYKFFEADNYKLSAYILPIGGYEVKAKDMDPGYRGIDDRDTQVMGGLEFSYTFLPCEVNSTMAIEAGKEGGTASFRLSRAYNITPNFSLVPTVSYTYYNDDIVDYYFGVDRHEATNVNSYNIHNTYEGKAGYRYGIGLLGNYKVSNSFSVVGFAGVTKLSTELSDSPIADNDVITAVGGGIVYSF